MGIFTGNCRYRYTGLVIFLFGCLLFNLSANDNIQILEPEIYPEKFITTQRISISLDIHEPYSQEMEFSSFSPEAPISIITRPYLHSARYLENRQWVYFTQIKLVLAVSEAGIYTLPQLSLYYNGTEYRMEERIISVLEPDESDYKYPVFLQWRDLPQTLYAGESVPLILEFLNLEEISLPDSIEIGNIEGGILENVNGVGRIEGKLVNGDTVYNVPAESWMLTASDKGILHVPAVQANLDLLKRNLSAQTINVLPLPETDFPIQAVGDINYSIDVPSVNAVSGEKILVSQIFEGHGNLKFSDFPELVIEGGSVVREENQQDISPGENGYSGVVTRISHVLFDSSGLGKITSPRFCIFDPDNETTYYIDSSSWDIDVSDKNQLIDPDKQDDFEPLKYKTTRLMRINFSADNPIWLLLVLPGFIYFFYQNFLRKRLKGFLFLVIPCLLLFSSVSPEEKQNEKFWINSAEDAWNAGLYAIAESRYLQIFEDFNYNPGIYYNLALTADARQDPALSFFYIRRGLLQKPGDAVLGDFFDYLSRKYGQDDQIALPVSWSRSYSFAAWIILANLFFVGYTFVSRNKKSVFIIFLVMESLLFLADTALIAWEYYSLNQTVAIIKNNAPAIKKVPRREGRDWFEIDAGSSVRVLEEINDFYLVENAYGLQGWMEQKYCLILQEKS